MSDNEVEILKISQNLSLIHKADLLAWVKLAYAVENAVQEPLGLGVIADNNPPVQPQI